MRNKIIVIDDHVEFLDMLKNLFKVVLDDTDVELHYFTDHLEVLDFYESYKSEIGLVISDYDMPGMNGIDLYKCLLLIDPKLKFVLVSGDFDFSKVSLNSNMVGLYEKPISSIISFAKDMIYLASQEK
jgi:two-component SAPR family response regulator